MTPKEKAEELAIKFTSSTDVIKPNLRSKEMALFCVDEIMYSYPTDPHKTLQPTGIKPLVYWREVKDEINLL